MARGRPGLTLVATGLGLFMIFLDATIVNVALPAIQHDFDVGENKLQWVVAAYSVTMAMFMMTSATFSDARGRRRAYVIGIVIFSAASLGCGAAPSVAFLNAMRALQGVGAAVVNVASLALVGAAYPDPKAKTRAVGLWTGIATIGLAIGPTFGGVLTESVGWRWIFLVNPVVAAATIGLTYGFVGESTDPNRHAFDPVGQVLFIGGIGALTFALVQAPVYGLSSALIIGLLIGSLMIMAPIAGRLAARLVSFQLPDKLEPVIQDPTERAQVVAVVVDAANPDAVPAVIGPAPSGDDDVPDRDQVVAAADEAFDDAIRIAEHREVPSAGT